MTPAAERQFATLSYQAREIRGRADGVSTDPRPTGRVKLAAGEALWRIRVRQYRIIYQILDDQLIVTVVKVGDRKDVYRCNWSPEIRP